MNAILTLALRSAWSRRSTLSLVVFSIALSTMLLLGLERIRHDVRDSFSQSVSGTDLIVGARTGAMQLMLYAVFRVGGATNNIRMESLQKIAQHRSVDWIVPLSLGDSHRGFSVLATTQDYFKRFRYGSNKTLGLKQGKPFESSLDGLYGCVIGADVAQKLNYHLGQKITLSHGSGAIPSAEHVNKPFTIVGILERTGTPVDRTVHISLEAMEAIHLSGIDSLSTPGILDAAQQKAQLANLAPRQVTAALIGLKSRTAVFSVQRAIADYDGEPLMAVLPGIALDELWNVVGVGEKALLGISAMVGVVSLAGLIAVVLAGLNERRRELAVVRAVGAAPRHVLLMLAAEGALVTLAGVALGIVFTIMVTMAASPWLQSHFGIGLKLSMPTTGQYLLLMAILMAGFLSSLVPGWRAYHLSLADGLSPRT